MNTSVLIFLILLGVIVGAGLYLFLWPRWRRALIFRREFPSSWEMILHEQLPLFAKLPTHLQERLRNLIKLFIHDKAFVGCAGLTINDEIRVVIAAQACLLILNRPSTGYSALRSVYVYPSAFRAVHTVRDELGLEQTESRDLLGESWSLGRVVLAWDDVQKGVRDFGDGYNVVLHEFAHQLDHESGATNGAPLLYSRAAYKSWAYVLGREFEKLQQSQPGDSIIDHYGATNPAEFFAVATETFFEEPAQVYEHHRELFEELKAYYRLDPRDWL